MTRFAMRVAVAAVSVGLGVGSAFAQAPSSDDKSFVADALTDNLAEVNFAKLALAKSTDPNIRQFAEKMIRDHELLSKSMQPFATQYKIKESGKPTLMDRVHYEDLKAKSGTSFDRAYVELMVKDHHSDLDTMIKERDTTQCPELKTLVTSAESVIKQHAIMIDKIAHMGGIETPAIPANA